jgi:hypothetical protein
VSAGQNVYARATKCPPAARANAIDFSFFKNARVGAGVPSVFAEGDGDELALVFSILHGERSVCGSWVGSRVQRPQK